MEFCAKIGLETFRPKCVVIYLQPKCFENCQYQDFGK